MESLKRIEIFIIVLRRPRIFFKRWHNLTIRNIYKNIFQKIFIDLVVGPLLFKFIVSSLSLVVSNFFYKHNKYEIKAKNLVKMTLTRLEAKFEKQGNNQLNQGRLMSLLQF